MLWRTGVCNYASRAHGADVELVAGDREATERAALEMSADIFYAGHNWHPMFLQGTKTLGYEIWEDLGFRIPDNIVILDEDEETIGDSHGYRSQGHTLLLRPRADHAGLRADNASY